MSLLDDARQLAIADDTMYRSVDGETRCTWCKEIVGFHKLSCLTRSLPKIATALETAEQCAEALRQSERKTRVVLSELEKVAGDLTIARRIAAQVDAALELARIDLEADRWPPNLAACDVIEKYIVNPVVERIDELEEENERLTALVATLKGEEPA